MYAKSEWLQKVNQRDQANVMPLLSQFTSYDRCSRVTNRRFKSLYSRTESEIIDQVICNSGNQFNDDPNDNQSGDFISMELTIKRIVTNEQ